METQIWQRQPQDDENCDYDYIFAGKMYISAHVLELPMQEVLSIVRDLKAFSQQGVDYLVVYKRADGKKIFCLDQISRKMMRHDYSKEEISRYNYFSIIFSDEY